MTVIRKKKQDRKVHLNRHIFCGGKSLCPTKFLAVVEGNIQIAKTIKGADPRLTDEAHRIASDRFLYSKMHIFCELRL